MLGFSHSFLLSLVFACLIHASNTVFVSEYNEEYCEVHEWTLKCDFKYVMTDVQLNIEVNKFRRVLVTNAQQLLLHEGVCTSLHLFHIISVKYNDNQRSGIPESDDCKARSLHLQNTTISNIPPSLHILSMEESRLTDTFSAQPTLKEVRVGYSYINKLYIDSPIRENGEVHLHNTKINVLSKLELTDNSKFFLTDSVVQVFDPNALVLSRNASTEIVRTTFLKNEEAKIIHMDGANIVMANITGILSVSYIQGDTRPTADRSYFISSGKTWTMAVVIVTILVLLATSITVNIFVVWLIRRRKCDEPDGPIKKTKIIRDIQEEDETIRQTKIVLISKNVDSF
ncbi:hypothetical protein SK128_004852 [Halocaridina rubra]|uniref:Uncharacterized protein n=1 Tax=Halocaridina rubra TaxID=373956 RepID=A0AAN8WWN5_HALRR